MGVGRLYCTLSAATKQLKCDWNDVMNFEALLSPAEGQLACTVLFTCCSISHKASAAIQELNGALESGRGRR